MISWQTWGHGLNPRPVSKTEIYPSNRWVVARRKWAVRIYLFFIDPYWSLLHRRIHAIYYCVTLSSDTRYTLLCHAIVGYTLYTTVPRYRRIHAIHYCVTLSSDTRCRLTVSRLVMNVYEVYRKKVLLVPTMGILGLGYHYS